jgi:hypothetical protein
VPPLAQQDVGSNSWYCCTNHSWTTTSKLRLLNWHLVGHSDTYLVKQTPSCKRRNRQLAVAFCDRRLLVPQGTQLPAWDNSSRPGCACRAPSAMGRLLTPSSSSWNPVSLPSSHAFNNPPTPSSLRTGLPSGTCHVARALLSWLPTSYTHEDPGTPNKSHGNMTVKQQPLPPATLGAPAPSHNYRSGDAQQQAWLSHRALSSAQPSSPLRHRSPQPPAATTQPRASDKS